MKLQKLLLTSLIAGFISVVGFSQISGSTHDLRGETWNSTGEICIVCHTPHNSASTLDAPLWNHATTTATFTLYTSSTLDATTGNPDGASKLCLSCHDGTVAEDSFGGATGTNFMVAADPEFIGTDLSKNHPISFTYDATLATADGGLFDPSTANSGLGGTIAADLLIGGKVQCSSCHDVHNALGTSSHLLVKSNAGSALCLTCHNK